MFLCPGLILLLLLLLRSSCRIVSCHLELIIYSSGQLAVGPIELMGTVTGQQREVEMVNSGMRDRLQSSDIVCHLGLLN